MPWFTNYVLGKITANNRAVQRQVTMCGDDRRPSDWASDALQCPTPFLFYFIVIVASPYKKKKQLSTITVLVEGIYFIFCIASVSINKQKKRKKKKKKKKKTKKICCDLHRKRGPTHISVDVTGSVDVRSPFQSVMGFTTQVVPTNPLFHSLPLRCRVSGRRGSVSPLHPSAGPHRISPLPQCTMPVSWLSLLQLTTQDGE